MSHCVTQDIDVLSARKVSVEDRYCDWAKLKKDARKQPKEKRPGKQQCSLLTQQRGRVSEHERLKPCRPIAHPLALHNVSATGGGQAASLNRACISADRICVSYGRNFGN